LSNCSTKFSPLTSLPLIRIISLVASLVACDGEMVKKEQVSDYTPVARRLSGSVREAGGSGSGDLSISLCTSRRSLGLIDKFHFEENI
jgi:hypothetical protein